jgi:ADP-ribose pyrophosphatase YjhB (NUDIX family)
MADVPLSPAALVGLLSEDERLRVVAALALGAAKPDDLLAATGLSPRDLGAALRRLETGGLVSTVDGQVLLHAEEFKAAARAAAPPEPPDDHGAGDPKVAAVLRAFIRGGRLTQMPTVAGKRQIVLEHIAAVFEPGVRYPEPAVNTILRAWHADYAMLRRYLVDSGLLDRADGLYWRIGGWVDLQPEPVEPEPAIAPEPRLEWRLGAYALVEDGDRVLLSRFAPFVDVGGLWMMPGGGVDHGEQPPDAAVREVYEETGMHVRVTALLDVYSHLVESDRDGPVLAQHVQVLYRAEVTGGTLGVVEVGGSTDQARWWTRAEIAAEDAPMTRYVRRALSRW